MTLEQKVRLKNRFELCEKELKRAKNAMCFWSAELGYVSRALAEDIQFNFNDFLTPQENENV